MTIQNLLHRGIFAVDMENSTSQLNPVKAHMRETLYEMVEDALLAGGITEQDRDPLIDRGDGILVLVHPADHVPKTRILSTVLPRLGTLLHENGRLRLRAVMHSGEVHHDQRGWFGDALDIAFRLLDAPRVKTHLRRMPAPLALVVSDDIYRSIVQHGYHGISERTYRRAVHVRIAGRTHHGWLHTERPISAGRVQHGYEELSGYRG
jgi:class 3 adenylate cyclase